jgi:hypothetical protein
MGYFSWKYSDTNKPVKNCVEQDSYLLVPKPFQKKYGEAIKETCYDGYGRFAGYDIFDLVIEWNKDMIPEVIRKSRIGRWKCRIKEEDIKNLTNYYEGKDIDCELRWLGIILACYDEDNARLDYPIKITSKKFDYDLVEPSKSDPNQGC